MTGERNTIDVLKTLATLELGHWTGLPEDASLDEARAVFSVDEQWRGAGTLGSDGGRRDWYSVSAANFPEGLRLWVDGDRLLLIDALRPVLPGGLDALLQELGQPTEKLESYLGTLPIKHSEWVYPDRGLTLYVNPANALLLRIAVYRSTSLEDYCNNLRLDLQRARLPINGQRISGGHR